ncbi:MAG: glutamine synthetase type III [Oscillospiraceae bacterium]|jgi:glutamine synthetase|nr:glutamine synthetase type III [Oscillospiraceae bacterium]MCI8943459.1 glutamine synthetase type III [Oscillospiraceae bacterium]
MEKVTKLFGSMVFNEEVMKQRLSTTCYKAWKKCVEEGTPLSLETAHEMAAEMKNWAMDRGATHFTHWFQPMTGVTAEKHDSFISPEGTSQVLMSFSGKELVRGEPDASSFPSGGLRATFEARGYTAWDPTAFAFIKDGSLCIPTIFCSYSGQALDKKTPLLRSMDELSRQAVRVLRLFGDTDVKKVVSQVGPEQEYFLIDKDVYDKREDLILTGRTLFGAKPPKGQELEDHYFGTIKPRVAAYMKELDEELWKLGILSKTKHNEVAPAQHEAAPIYSDANTACDHNQLTMEIMKKVAGRHGMVCLLHEKPFAGVNGSGKHDNWSISTDTGMNLFRPGSTPSQNARFLLFLAAFIKGVDEYQDLLRCSVANPGNDHRLGAQEAPPAIISVFLGDELTAIVDSIINDTKYVEQGKKTLSIGVDSLPAIPQDTTDRNRTSPLAFTGNKFEFRMLGSSQSISGPNTALNTIMAEELSQFADKLEGAEDFNAALHDLVKRVLTDHQRIIFNGNGYEDAWVEEARKRGLSNLTCTADALKTYLQPKHIELFSKHHVFTEEELRARNEIHLENYCEVVGIEARTMIDMVKRNIFPAVSRFSGDTAKAVATKKAVLADLDCSDDEALLRKLSALSVEMMRQTAALEDALAAPHGKNAYEAAHYYRYTVFEIMGKLRASVDALEAITSRDCWPYPSYTELLFSVK